ncbi:hypothetical protein NL676_012872 [Syzygium grande]|nr:hypothetical protein NL676_012872 [Syzygium grande]
MQLLSRISSDLSSESSLARNGCRSFLLIESRFGVHGEGPRVNDDREGHAVYGADPAIIKALADTGVGIVIGAASSDVPSLASDPGTAARWVGSNILPFRPAAGNINLVTGAMGRRARERVRDRDESERGELPR